MGDSGKPVRNRLVAQARGDGGLDEAKMVKMEKHKHTKNAFGRQNLWDHSECVLSVSDVPCLVLGPLCIHSLGHSTDVSSACSHTFDPLLWRRKWQPTPVSLPGQSHGQRNLEDYSPWGRKELDTTEATEREHVGDSDNEKLTTLLLWLIFSLCPSAIDGNQKLESTQIIGLSRASFQNDRALHSHQE